LNCDPLKLTCNLKKEFSNCKLGIVKLTDRLQNVLK